MFGRKTQQHAVKPVVHLGIVAVIASGVVAANVFGLLTPETSVPDSIMWVLNKVMSTTGLYIALAVAATLALAHRWFNKRYDLRSWIRKAFFYALAIGTGKFYSWAGLLLGMWVVSRFTNLTSGRHDDTMLVYGVLSVAVGFVLWVFARHVAFRELRKLGTRQHEGAG